MATQQRPFDVDLVSETRPILYALCVMLALAMAFGSFVFYQTLKRSSFRFECRYVTFSIGNTPATAKKPEAKPEAKKAPPAPAPATAKAKSPSTSKTKSKANQNNALRHR